MLTTIARWILRLCGLIFAGVGVFMIVAGYLLHQYDAAFAGFVMGCIGAGSIWLSLPE